MRPPVQPFRVALSLPQSLPDGIADVIRDCLFDLASVLINDGTADLVARSEISTTGAEHTVISGGFRPEDFDLKIRSALRAAGFQVDLVSHRRVPVAGLDAATVGQGGGVVMTSPSVAA